MCCPYQTMLRIKDPNISVPFYQTNFGFQLIHKYILLSFNIVSYTCNVTDMISRNGILVCIFWAYFRPELLCLKLERQSRRNTYGI
jgi:hypothetical protein